MNVDKIRSVIIKILLGTLVATSLVAIGVILTGSATDIVGRIIWTLIAGLFYLGILLAILSTIPHIDEGPKNRSSLFVVNSILALTCASYLTSILSIWTVISGDLPLRIHLAYIVLLAGILYAKPLIDVEGAYPKIRRYVQANYAFIAIASTLTAFAIVAPTEWDLWGGFYGRIIAAAVVTCVTLSMVITVIYHLYLQQKRSQQTAPTSDNITVDSISGQPVRPVTSAQTAHAKPVQRTSPWMIVGIILLAIFGLPVLLGIIGVLVAITGGIGSSMY